MRCIGAPNTRTRSGTRPPNRETREPGASVGQNGVLGGLEQRVQVNALREHVRKPFEHWGSSSPVHGEPPTRYFVSVVHLASRRLRFSNKSRVLSVQREIDAQWVAEVRVLFVLLLRRANPRSHDPQIANPHSPRPAGPWRRLDGKAIPFGLSSELQRARGIPLNPFCCSRAFCVGDV